MSLSLSLVTHVIVVWCELRRQQAVTYSWSDVCPVPLSRDTSFVALAACQPWPAEQGGI